MSMRIYIYARISFNSKDARSLDVVVFQDRIIKYSVEKRLRGDLDLIKIKMLFKIKISRRRRPQWRSDRRESVLHRKCDGLWSVEKPPTPLGPRARAYETFRGYLMHQRVIKFISEDGETPTLYVVSFQYGYLPVSPLRYAMMRREIPVVNCWKSILRGGESKQG